MAKWSWIERSFSFEFPVEKWPDLLERWRGTPARLEERIGGVPKEILTRKPDHGWSIQENVGHLMDLEYLPAARIEQILAGDAELVAADMTNETTNSANHNSADVDLLLQVFRSSRFKTVARLESLRDADWSKSALHPRIKKQMRIVDIVFFDSEHDDYHVGRIGELIRAFSGD